MVRAGEEPFGFMTFDIDSAFVTPQTAVDAYDRDGFVRLPGVLGPEALAHYGASISSEVLRRNPQAEPIEARDTYHRAFLQITNLWQTSDLAKEFVFGKRLASIAATLLRVPHVRLYHDQALYKEPGGEITPWHADQFYWPLDSNKAVTAWVPLQATPLEMGPLAFAAGSHRMRFGRDLEIGDESERSLGKALRDGRFPERIASFALGEVSFHSGWTFHHAGANRTQRPRAAMTIIYIADGIRLAEPTRKQQYADWRAFMPGVSPGEAVASVLNPLLA